MVTQPSACHWPSTLTNATSRSTFSKPGAGEQERKVTGPSAEFAPSTCITPSPVAQHLNSANKLGNCAGSSSSPSVRGNTFYPLVDIWHDKFVDKGLKFTSLPEC